MYDAVAVGAAMADGWVEKEGLRLGCSGGGDGDGMPPSIFSLRPPAPPPPVPRF